MKTISERLIKFFSWASCRRRCWFPWVFLRRSEFDSLKDSAVNAGRELLHSLHNEASLHERIARLEREWREAHQANSELLHKLSVMRSYFDRLVVVEPRTKNASGKAVTIAIPNAVLAELKSGGEHLQSEFSRELGRRLVFRALRELFDSPPEFLTVNKEN